MRLELELLARLLVDVRRPEDRPPLRLRRQRNRTGYLRSRLFRCPHDVRRRLIDHRVIEGLEANSDSASHLRFLEGLSVVGCWLLVRATSNQQPGTSNQLLEDL